MNYQTPKIIRSGSHRILYQLLAIFLAMLSAAAGGYFYSQNNLRSAERELMSVIDTQEKHVQELLQQLTASGEQLAVLERASQIDREAVEQIKQQLALFQEEHSKQEEELTFLRSLVASKDDREGLQVRRFTLKKGSGDGEFIYRFTVSQTLANGDEANGWIFVGLDGTRNGEPAWLPLREISAEKTERLKMRFKNFQDVEGVVKVPDDFSPLKFMVEVKPSNKKIPEVKQRFDWKIESQ